MRVSAGILAGLPPLTVAAPLIAAAVLATAGRVMPRWLVNGIALLAAGAVTVDTAVLVAVTGGGRRVVSWPGGWLPRNGFSVGIALVADRLGAGLALLVAASTVAVLVYAGRYFPDFRKGDSHFHALLMLFLAGMCGFALTGDLFDAFVYFELMGAVAYALTGYRIEEKRAVQGALSFGILNSLGAYCSLLGIGLLYAHTGQLGFAQIGRALTGHQGEPLVVVAFVLVLTGLVVKAAVVPFHFWLADAHAVAPTPVCMLLSGVMVELGVYGVARIYWTVFAGAASAAGVHRALLTLGVLTAVLGAAMCWQQRHLKRLLAFSTIAHVGLFLVGVALLDQDGLAGAALYVAGHAGVKAALFALVGILLDRFASVDEHELHGRGRTLPGVAVLTLVGGLVLAGLPPFGAGLGKALLEDATGARAGGWAFAPIALIVLVSAVTGGAVLRMALRVFFGAGPARQQAEDGDETAGANEEPDTGVRVSRVPVPMLLVPAVLLACCLALGVWPGAARMAGTAAAAFIDRTGYAAQVLDGVWRPAATGELSGWTAEGVALGVTSAALAAGLAAVAVWGPLLRGAGARRVRSGIAVVVAAWRPVRRLHSGHLGDYVAWLFAGIALFALLIGIPLR